MSDKLRITTEPLFRQRLEKERERRGHKTLAKTLRDLAVERLLQVETQAPTAPGNAVVHAGR